MLTKSAKALFAFWAKLPHDNDKQNNTEVVSLTRFHPVLCHMLDVGAVAQALWREVLTRQARRQLAKSFAMPEVAVEFWLAFLIALHDLGKAAPVFQLIHKARPLHHLYCELPSCPPNDPPAVYHQWITAVELPRILPIHFGMGTEMAERFGIILGGHHGSFPRSGDLSPMGEVEFGDCDERVGVGGWVSARDLLTLTAADVMLGDARRYVPADDGSALSVVRDNAAALLLAGYTTIADWVGSDENFFPFAVNVGADGEFTTACFAHLDAHDYFEDAQKKARRALERAGWLGWRKPGAGTSFARLFAHITAPDDFRTNNLQDTVEKLAGKIQTPCLVIIEAPMGEGKTEAAMYLADVWNADHDRRGCYFALPSQATSNQMYRRVKEFLEARFPGTRITYHLAHGHAALNSEAAPPVEPENVGTDDAKARESAAVAAAEWFAKPKRALLAPYGVGTVDQALFAVLQTRHYFVRHFGLAHKAIIVDEVHAYDAYTTGLLKMLLRWLAALDAPIVLLSATLPAARRAELLKAYAEGRKAATEVKQVIAALPKVKYPRVTYLSASGSDVVPVVASGKGKTLKVEWVTGCSTGYDPGEEFTLGSQLRDALEHGGCATLICNTVDRAQDVYRALGDYFTGDADDGLPVLDLFHARFRQKERADIERRVLSRFGKPEKDARRAAEDADEDDESVPPVRRPHRAVLVATQVIEQSLDLDFDLMVSDFAPIDLLLQRSGRICRHSRPERPGAFRDDEPRLWLCAPEERGGIPRFDDGTAKVYEDNSHVMLRSWLELKRRTNAEGHVVVEIPEDIDILIEAAYSETEPPDNASPGLRREWEETMTKQKTIIEELARRAAAVNLPSPLYESDFFEVRSEELEEDNPDVNKLRQALTRSEPGVQVVCLLPDEVKEVRLGRPPDRAATRYLLERAVNISSKDVREAVLKLPSEKSWKKSAHLRRHRLLRFNADRRCPLNDRVTLELDEKLGLRFLRKGMTR